jgi:rhodanese-related sulfurtransferase
VLALGVIALAAFALLGGSNQNATATLPAEVSVQKAAELHTAGVFVLDVREPDEWAQAHIPGATLIPLGELQARVNELPKDQPVLVYCRSGNRSAAGRDFLKTAGFENVTSMSGGITQWIAAGYETVSGE